MRAQSQSRRPGRYRCQHIARARVAEGAREEEWEREGEERGRGRLWGSTYPEVGRPSVKVEVDHLGRGANVHGRVPSVVPLLSGGVGLTATRAERATLVLGDSLRDRLLDVRHVVGRAVERDLLQAEVALDLAVGVELGGGGERAGEGGEDEEGGGELHCGVVVL